MRSYAMWHPQWGGYVGKCVVTYCITKDDRGKQNNTCFDVKVWHDGDFPTDDDGGETQEFHYCDPEQLIRFGRRVIKAMNDGGVDIVDPVEVAEKRAADAELETVAAQGVIDIVHNILESTLDVLPLGAAKHPRVASALKVRSEVDALRAENAKLRAALRQVEMAARFPDASDAWDQVRDGVSVLHG